MSNLGCVYCDPTNTNWQPTKFYILDGCSVCEYCLRKMQTQNEDPEEPIDVVAKALTGVTMRLYSAEGVCLMESPVPSPVISGDSISFPPIQISM
jgi:hypothetical protein